MSDNSEVIFEFHPIGPYMKVTAMDSKTLIEVSVQGPLKTARHYLQNMALQKLKRAIEEKKK